MDDIVESNVVDLSREPEKVASARNQAKKLGLSYLGFGRYGLKSDGAMHVTHFVKNEKLVPITKTTRKKVGDKEQTVREPPSVPKEFDSWTNQYGEKYRKAIEKEPAPSPSDAQDAQKATRISHILDSMDANLTGEKIRVIKKNIDHYKEVEAYKIPRIFDVIHEMIGDTDDVNSLLYSDTVPDPVKHKTAAWKIREMDKAFATGKFKAKTNYSVYTGTAATLVKGKKFTFKGFLSTSIRPGTTLDFAEKKERGGPVIIQIDIQKDQDVIDFEALYDALHESNRVAGVGPNKKYIGDDFHDYGHVEEEEHMLPRNTVLEIIDEPIESGKDEPAIWRARIVKNT